MTSRTKGKSEVEFLISREQVQPGVDDVVAGWSRGGLLATQTVASYKHTQDTKRIASYLSYCNWCWCSFLLFSGLKPAWVCAKKHSTKRRWEVHIDIDEVMTQITMHIQARI